MAKHSKFSPSGADRWMRCTASFYEHKNTATDSPYAREGTSAHDLAAKVLEGDEELENWKGKKYGDVKLTPANLDALEMYVSELDSLKFLHEDPEEHIEKRVKNDYGVWGTLDHGLESLNRLDISDLKFGKGVVVSAKGNYQLLTYLSLAVKNLYEDQGLNPPETLCTRIIQPRARTGEVRSEHYYSVGELKAFRKAQLDRIKEIKSGQISYNPSDKACQWCSAAKDGCKAYNEYMMEKAGVDFAEFIEDPVANFPKVELVPRISDEEILTIFQERSVIKKYLEAVEEAAINRQKDGANFPGMKLIQSNTHLKIRDEVALKRLLRNAKFKRKDYIEEKIISPSQLKKLVKNMEDPSEILDEIYQPAGEARLVADTAKGRDYDID